MGGNKQLQKLLVATIMGALSFVASTIIIFPNMAPLQHMFNVVGAVILGPTYNFFSAFLTGILRMTLTGSSIAAVVGAVVGAWLSAVLYKYVKKFFAAVIGETIGTGIISAFLMYVINNIVFGLNIPNFYYYIPFYLPSAIIGSLLGWALLKILERQKLLDKLIVE